MGFPSIPPEVMKAYQDAEAKKKELNDAITPEADWKFKASGFPLKIKSVDTVKERVAIDYGKFKGIEISYDDLKSSAEPVK